MYIWPQLFCSKFRGWAWFQASWYNKIWSWVPRDSKPNVTVLARLSSNLPDRQFKISEYGRNVNRAASTMCFKLITFLAITTRVGNGGRGQNFSAWFPSEMKLREKSEIGDATVSNSVRCSSTRRWLTFLHVKNKFHALHMQRHPYNSAYSRT
jgi:hypothetical protein